MSESDGIRFHRNNRTEGKNNYEIIFQDGFPLAILLPQNTDYYEILHLKLVCSEPISKDIWIKSNE